MFSKARIGDKVWSVRKGWGKIILTVADEYYPIIVRYEDAVREAYTKDGKLMIGDRYPTLFWDEIKFKIPEQPKRRLKKWIGIIQNDDNEVRVIALKWGSNRPDLFDSAEEAALCSKYFIKAVEVEIEEE